MEAPLGEMLTRLVLAVVMTVVLIEVAQMTRVMWGQKRPSRWVALYMTFTLALFAGWRWFILWLGSQAETPDYQVHWEPLIRSLGNWLLILLTASIGIMAFHHMRELRKGRSP